MCLACAKYSTFTGQCYLFRSIPHLFDLFQTLYQIITSFPLFVCCFFVWSTKSSFIPFIIITVLLLQKASPTDQKLCTSFMHLTRFCVPTQMYLVYTHMLFNFIIYEVYLVENYSFSLHFIPFYHMRYILFSQFFQIFSPSDCMCSLFTVKILFSSSY